MDKTWVCIKGYKARYMVSSNGEVKSLDHIDSRGASRIGRMLKQHINKPGYGFVRLSIDGKKKMKLVHRVVAEAFLNDYSEEMIVDHIDGNPLNNNADNLRMSTLSQNIGNSKKSSGTLSKYKGVTYSKKTRKWIARIQKDKKMHNIGSFNNEEDAASEYDKHAIKCFGEFAKTNESLGLFKENN